MLTPLEIWLAMLDVYVPRTPEQRRADFKVIEGGLR
jgi:hypothetical protein